MKHWLHFLCLLMVVPGLAQDEYTVAEIAEAEMKAASGLVTFRANANTSNYDLTYHRMEFTIDPEINFISGDVTSHFIAKENLSQLIFDLDDNLTVSGVSQSGTNLSFVQTTDDELIITLPQVQNQGVLDSVTVSYSGVPETTGFGSFTQATHAGDPIIWTLSEPYGAKTWWPCKQDLNDKIDLIDVYITTPLTNPDGEDYIAVANGVEQSQLINGSSKTTHYRHAFPIPAYLIAIAVTNYTVFSQTVPNNGNPFDIVNYVFPEDLATAQNDTPVTVDIMNLFTDLFEEYPFASEKYGHAQFTRSGGMEHTTVSFMGNYSRNLIAHELAHQWFGNKITCGSWQDIWLNEGFATYLSGLVVEHLDGDAAFDTWKLNRNQFITAFPDGYVYLTESDTTSVQRIFDSRLSYNKAAMVLHMLRKKLGDAIFYQGLQNYLVHPDLSFGYARTEDFIPIMEQASGEDLNEFFNDWLYNEGYPSYTLEWNQFAPNQVRFVINQAQSHPSVDFFEAPVPLRLVGTLGEELDVVLDNTQNGQEFFQTVDFEIADVLFDPRNDLISRDNLVLLSEEEYNPFTELVMFPNPARDIIKIAKPTQMQLRAIRIFNMLGQLVMESEGQEELDISELSTGTYPVWFETNTGRIEKILVKH